MIKTQSARDILKESEIKNKLKECFKKCAAGRQQLRICVSNSMSKGLSKEEILVIISEMGTKIGQDESSLKPSLNTNKTPINPCSIIAKTTIKPRVKPH